MLIVTFSQPTLDYQQGSYVSITGASGQHLRSYEITSMEDYRRWLNLVERWYIYNADNHSVSFCNDKVNYRGYQAVCLDCGYKSWQNYKCCPHCESKREPVYLEI